MIAPSAFFSPDWLPERARMHLVAPDILAEARGLSLAASGTAVVVGLLLWLFGAWGHRFWLVLATTLAAGVLGLSHGPDFGVQRLVAGLMLGVTAGVLALSLVRLLAFVAGGLAGLLTAQALAPAWEEAFVAFFASGLLGLLLFRLWMRLLTSLAGTLLTVHGGILLADRLGKIHAVEWTTRRQTLLDWAAAGAVLLGVLAQWLLERRRARLKREQEEEQQRRQEEERARRSRKRSWWGWGPPKKYRRAG
jgi:hypothetical protein